MKVLTRQLNSRMCIICGLDNPFGLKAPFFNLDDNSVATIFEFKAEHQSYPGRTHGGLISAMLDEVMGRALWVQRQDMYAVTTTLSITYRKPVPYNQKIKARGYIVKDTSRIYTAQGEIYDMQNNLLASAQAQYLKLDGNKIVDDSVSMHKEMCYCLPAQIENIDFPPKNII